jgi:hypothetical protein
MTGPSKNPIENSDMTVPRLWVGTRSAIVPPALLTEHDAVHPCRNRITIKQLIVGDNAHPAENAQNPTFAIL